MAKSGANSWLQLETGKIILGSIGSFDGISFFFVFQSHDLNPFDFLAACSVAERLLEPWRSLSGNRFQRSYDTDMHSGGKQHSRGSCSDWSH